MNRTVVITNNAYLNLKHESLVIKQDVETLIPLDDIAFLYIEDNSTTISVPLINALAENNVMVVVCDSKHIPNVYITPYKNNVLCNKRQQLQLKVSNKLKHNLWEQIISTKIENQRRVLRFNDKNFEKLLKFKNAEHEGIAARVYFSNLFGKDFIRHENKYPNIHLNYGYSILRSLVIKNIVVSGLNPSLSLYHTNRSNPFTLADDMMEVFRPLIDDIVYNQTCDKDLDREQKAILLGFLNKSYNQEGIMTPVNDIVKSMVMSYIACMKGEKRKLKILYYEK